MVLVIALALPTTSPLVAFAIVAVATLGTVGPFMAWQDMRAERDVAVGRAAPKVRLETEPTICLDEWRLRLRLFNDSSRSGRFTAQVREILGVEDDGPEVPFHVAWRGAAGKWDRDVLPGSDEILDLAMFPRIDLTTAKDEEIQRWYPTLVFQVPSDEDGRAPIGHHSVALKGLDGRESCDGAQVRIRVTAWERAADEPVADHWFVVTLADADDTLKPSLTRDETPPEGGAKSSA